MRVSRLATSEQLIEQSTRHQVFLERVKTGEANQFAAFLIRMDRLLRQRLLTAVLTDLGRARVELLIADIARSLSGIYDEFWGDLQGRLLDIAQYEAGFEARSLDQVLTDFETVIPGDQQIRAAVLSAPMSVRGADGGKLLEPFIKDWSAVEVKRVTGAIRQGFFEGQTNSQIVQAIRGTKANQFRDGVLAVSKRNAESVVRTAVQHTASVARQETWNANSDLVTGVRWVSTLDARTTQQCRSLDGLVFPADSGPRPPIHVNCRSTTVAELDDRFAFLKQGATRASKDGYVDADLTYYGWLKKQPAGFQDEAIGPTRAALLREGGLSAERFAEINLGKTFEPLTLDQMRDLEPLAFERAGI